MQDFLVLDFPGRAKTISCRSEDGFRRENATSRIRTRAAEGILNRTWEFKMEIPDTINGTQEAILEILAYIGGRKCLRNRFW